MVEYLENINPTWITAGVALILLVEKMPHRTRRKIVGAVIWLIPSAMLVAVSTALGLALWMAVLVVAASEGAALGWLKYYPTIQKHTFHYLFHDE